ncbi:MAG: type II toxin-antitoxin system RelE/ParE family toxin [Nanoarchaeota archaeon]
MVKEVRRSNNFLNRLKKLDKSYIDKIEKILLKIIQNPEIGKPMRFDRKGTREVYIKPFRLSYAYDNYKDILYLLDLYHKDEQ